MMKTTIAFGLLLLSSLPALAQQPENLPDPAAQRAQTQATVNQQLQQTQMDNLQMQQSLQHNANRQQRQFNAMPAPAYQQPHVVIKPPPAPKPATTTP
jgi:hypothetical protein